MDAGTTTYPGLITVPWKHQQDTIDFTIAAFEKGRRGVMHHLEMGCGKTLGVIALRAYFDWKRTVVLCPKSVIPVWPSEFDKHSQADIVCADLTPKTMKAKLKRLAEATAKAEKEGLPLVVVLNYESAASKLMAAELCRNKWDALVLDEIHRIKSPTGSQSKFVRKLADRCSRRIGLTGTAFPHSLLDAWAQFRALDKRVLGDNYTLFRARFAEFGVEPPEGMPQYQVDAINTLQSEIHRGVCIELAGQKSFRSPFRENMAKTLRRWLEDPLRSKSPFTPNMWHALTRNVEPGRFKKIVGFKNTDIFHRALAPVMYEVKAAEVLDLPEQHHIRVPITLEPSARKAYDLMAEEMVAWLDEMEDQGIPVTASNAMDKMIKLQQICCGHIRDEGRLIDDVSTAKEERLVSIFEDLPPDEAVLVIAKYAPDLDRIHRAAKTAGRKSIEVSGPRKDIGAKWEPGEETVLAGQLKAVSLGLDTTRARHVVYYSLGFNNGDYLQSLKRSHRPGQKHAVRYHHLVAIDTIEEVIYAVLGKRTQLADEALASIRKLRGGA